MPKKLLPPIHPGETLLEEFLKPLGISQYRLAKEIGVPPPAYWGDCGRQARHHCRHGPALMPVLRAV